MIWTAYRDLRTGVNQRNTDPNPNTKCECRSGIPLVSKQVTTRGKYSCFIQTSPHSAFHLRQPPQPGLETTRIEYFRLRDRILAFVVTENGLEITPITNPARIAQALRMLQFRLSKFRLDRGYALKFRASLLGAAKEHLHEMYQELLAPVRNQLKGRRLIVIPTETLHHVPFHALFDGAQYLVDSFAVSYAPSASIYAQCCKKLANPAGVP